METLNIEAPITLEWQPRLFAGILATLNNVLDNHASRRNPNKLIARKILEMAQTGEKLTIKRIIDRVHADDQPRTPGGWVNFNFARWHELVPAVVRMLKTTPVAVLSM